MGTSGEGAETLICGMHGIKLGEGEIEAVWLHGGGYVFGSPKTHARAAAYVAQKSGLTIFIPEYPLAPEHHLSEIIDAVTRFVKALPNDVSLIGDSAGGHLAIFTAQRCVEHVSSVVLFSPNTDRLGLSATRKINSEIDIMNNHETDELLFYMAVENNAKNKSAYSTSNLDLSCFPKTLIHVASNEVLLDDSLMFARQLSLAHRSVSMKLTSGLFHMFQQWPEVLPQAKYALNDASAFLKGSNF